MSWGLRNRLDRVLPGLPNGVGSVMFAIDHGYFMGPTSGLENPRDTIVPLLPHADSLMLSRGILQNSIPKRTNIPIVLRVSSGNSILNEDMSNVVRKFMTGKYKRVVFSDELLKLKDFKEAKTSSLRDLVSSDSMLSFLSRCSRASNRVSRAARLLFL